MIIPASLATGYARQFLAAARRSHASQAARRRLEQLREAGSAFPDTAEWLALRARRLVEQHAVSAEMLRHTVPPAGPVTDERVLGAANDLQLYSFLPRGARAAQSVGRVWWGRAGSVNPIATGFLVAPALMLTNHHVLPEVAVCRDAFVEFGAEVDVDNRPGTPVRFGLDPDTCFVTDEHLDFTLVAVSPTAGGTLPGAVYGYCRLIAAEGKLAVGDALNIIGHPQGRMKEIAIRGNRLTQRLEEFLRYETDTLPGNSGSPVFNDQWEVVALHHSSVPRTDVEGRAVRRDGTVWQPGQPDADIDWVANEGVRISVLLRHLARLELPAHTRALLAQLGPESGLAAPPGPSTTATTAAPVIPGQAGPGRISRASETVALARAGLSAPLGPFPSGCSLVFLHGRAQGGRNPVRLRREWTAGLNRGLTLAGLATVTPGNVWFPYYGDLLDALTSGSRLSAQEMLSTPAAALAPESESARRLYSRLLSDAADRAGFEGSHPSTTGCPTVWEVDLPSRLHDPLGWLADHTGLDGLVIAAAFRDVAAYLDDPRVRDGVLAQVLQAVPTCGEVVLVAHSLGTVVAIDLLGRLAPQVRVKALVTTGSPLGMDDVYRRLLLPDPERPARPPRVRWWFNAWCQTDPVAIGCPLAEVWDGVAAETVVANDRDHAHDVAAYLGHPEVAEAIGEQLGLGRTD